MYSEETDLSKRLAAIGLETHLVPAARVEHIGQMSTAATPGPRAVEMARARRRYWDLHYTRPARVAARAAVSLQFAALGVAAAATRRRGKGAFLAQARVSLGLRGGPGLRELADEWNELHAADDGKVSGATSGD